MIPSILVDPPIPPVWERRESQQEQVDGIDASRYGPKAAAEIRLARKAWWCEGMIGTGVLMVFACSLFGWLYIQLYRYGIYI